MRKIQMLFAVLFLLFFFLTVSMQYKWDWVALLLYSLPLVLQASRSSLVRVYSLWFGAFLVIQTVVSPLILNNDYLTLQPNFNRVKEVDIPGIDASQELTTDAQGYRTVKKINYEQKPSETLRIFAIGGSTTAQPPIDDRKTWTYLLQGKLDEHLSANDVEVINTGLSGLRARHHFATLKHILSFDPDIAIFLVGINDWNRHIVYENLPFSDLPIFSASVRSAMNFRETLLGKTLKNIADVASASWKKGGGRGARATGLNGTPDDGNKRPNSLLRSKVLTFKPSEVLAEYEYYLDRISDVCKQNEITCIFVSQPSAYKPEAGPEIRSRLWMTPPKQDYTLDFESLIHVSSLYNSYLDSFAKTNGFHHCDIADAVEPSLVDLYDDCHFTLSGSEKVSQLLFSCLLETPGIARKLTE